MRIKFSLGKLNFGAFLGSGLYEGANNSRNRTAIPYSPTDSKRELNRFTRRQLMSKARYFYANDGFARGAIRETARYAIGHGLRPQAQTENAEWNAMAEAFWEQWCKIADVTGKNHFNRIQRLISVAIDRDGDIGVLLLKTKTGFPQIQLIESHRIGSMGDDGETWVDGVKVDELNRPLAYRVIVGRDVVAGKWVDVSARDMVLVFEPERADQVRGVTALYHAINTIHDKKDILDFERIGVKNMSAIAAVLKTDDGTTEAEDWRDTEDENDATEGTRLTLAQLQSGQIPVIGKDEELTMHSSDRPSPAFTGFLDFLIRDVATGLGLPYEFVWNPEKLGGTAQRFVLEKAQRRFRERQDLMKSMLLDRLWFWVVSVAMQRGDLPYQEGAYRVSWQTPSELTVDAGRDGQQDREDLKMGLTTEARIYGKQGLDWVEERDQREREIDDLMTRARKLAAKHGVTTEFALQLLQLTTPNANMSGGKSEDDEDRDDDPKKSKAKKKDEDK
jgi:lambda family phage portal protein